MKIKLDENIPLQAQFILKEFGHNVDTVIEENLAGHTDDQVWSAAQENVRFLITQDLDFSDIHRYKPGAHAGLLLIRLRDNGRKAILHRLKQVFSTEDVESWRRCFVVISERKIRVRRQE